MAILRWAPARQVLSMCLGLSVLWLSPALIAPANAQTPTATVTALTDQYCGGDRHGSSLGCTANDFTANVSFTQSSSNAITTCIAGQTISVNLIATINSGSPQRYNAGIFFGQNGNDPRANNTPGANNDTQKCSLGVFPLSPSPFINSDGNVCGDYIGNNTSSTLEVDGVKVTCQPVSSTDSTLSIPFMMAWDNSTGACTTSSLTASTNSKCSSSSSGFGNLPSVIAQGYVKLTKATFPGGDPQSFTFNTSSTWGTPTWTDTSGAATTNTLHDGETKYIQLPLPNSTNPTQQLTITEQLVSIWDPTVSIVCTGDTSNGNTSGNPVTSTNNGTRQIVANLTSANYGAACTITNYQNLVRTKKALAPVSDPGRFDLSTQTNIATATATNVGDGGATAYEQWTSGTVTFSEQAEPGTALANYTTTVACVDDTVSGSLAPASTNLTDNTTRTVTLAPPLHHQATCTFTNTRISATLQLAKSWTNGHTGDIASIGATTGLTNNTGAFGATAPSAGSSATVTVYSGETATLPAETMSGGGLLANYNTTLSCGGGALSGTNGQTSNTLTIAPGDGGKTIVCTYSNSRKSATFQLRKTWTNSNSGDGATIGATTGLTNNTALFSATAPTSNNSGAAVTVYAGDVGTLPVESMSPAGTANSYTTSIVCSGGTLSGSGNGQASGNTITINSADAGSAVFCTYNNSRKSATLRLAKAWGANSNAGDTATVTLPSGFINSASLTSGASTAPTNTTGSFVTVYAGESGQIAESGTNIGNYTPSYACDNGVSVTSGGVVSIAAADAGKTITCTVTNTRKSATLTLQKTWAVNSIAGNVATVTSSGFTNNASSGTSTATSAGNTTTGTAVTVYAGELGTISESFSSGSAANYTATLSCSGNGTALSGNTLTVSSSDTAITCTETNTRKGATLTLKKTWSANSNAGDVTTVSSAGFINNATSGSSTATAAGNTTTGTSVTVYLGESGTISESFSSGNATNYTSVLSCSGNSIALSGNTLTVGAGDTAITCTETNTRKSATLTLQKTWAANSIAGDQTTVSTAGFANNASSGSSTALAAGNTTTGASVAVFAGESGTIGESNFANIANYAQSISCSGGGSLSGNSLTIAAADAGKSIVCTETNTRKSATLTLQKTWSANSIGGDQTTVSTTGFTNVATSGSSTALAAGNTTTGAAVTVYAGEFGTIGESNFANIGDYAQAIGCTGGGSLSGNSLTISAADAGKSIVCTETNTRKSATLKLAKAWAAGSNAGDTATVTIPSGFINSASLTSGASTAPTGTTGSGVAVYAGESGQIAESGTNIGNYTAGYVCDNGVSVTSGGVVSIGAADAGKTITCTLTNTRKSHTLTVLKALSPTSDTGAFVMNANGTAGTAGGNGATSSATVFVGATANFSEAASGATSLSNYTSNWSCNTTPAATTGSGTSGSLTMPDADITCTITNTRKTHSVTVTKALAPVADSGTFVMNANGTTGSAGGNGATSSATVNVGDTATFSEAAGGGATTLSNYTSSWSCNTTPAATTGSGTSGSLTMPDSNITCTITNTRKTHSVTVQKFLSPTSDLGKFDLQVNGTTRASNVGNGGSGSTTGLSVGDAITVAELGNGTNLNYYTTALSCTGGGVSVTPSANNQSGTFTLPDADVTCTFTNTRKTHSVTVQKSVSDSGKFDLQVNGSAVATNVGNGGSGNAPGLFVGDTISVAEQGNATYLGSYTTTLSCSGVTVTAGANNQSGTFVLPDADVTCTFTNSPIAPKITLQKNIAARADSSDQFDVTIGGTPNSTASTSGSTTGDQTPVATITATAGNNYTINEAMHAGSVSTLLQYNQAVSCSNALSTANGGTDVSGINSLGATITPRRGDDITCKITNTPKPATVKLTKISNGGVGTFNFNGPTNLDHTTDTVTTTTQGLSATSTQTNTVTTLNSQVAITEGAAASYTLASASCKDSNSAATGNAASFGSLSGSTLTIAAANVKAGAAIECTFTNNTVAALTMSKSNASPAPLKLGVTSSYTIVVANSGFTAASSATVSEAIPSGEIYTGFSGANWSCTPAAPQTGSITLTCSYAAAIAGSGGTSSSLVISAKPVAAAVGSTLTNKATVDPTGGNSPQDPTTCTSAASGSNNSDVGGAACATATDTATAATLTLTKTWTNGRSGDGVSATTSGGTSVATFSSTAPTGTTGTTVVEAVGDTITLPVETAGSGFVASNYTTAISCSGNAVALAGSTPPQTLTISAGDGNVVCAYSNVRKSATLQLAKTWTNALSNGDQANIGATSGLGSNTAAFSATAPNANNSGAAVVVFAGDIANLPAETIVPAGNQATYTTSLGCSGGGTFIGSGNGQVGGNSVAFGSGDAGAAIVCTYSNVLHNANLAISKDDGVTTVTAGGTTTYTVTVTNNGPGAADGATVTDPAASGLVKAAVSCSASGAAVCPSSLTVAKIEAGVAIPTLPNGGSVTFTIPATVTAASGSVTNGATVTAPSGTVDPDSSNNSASDTDTVGAVADLSIAKSGPSTINDGATLSYTILVGNAGPSSADGALFVDPAVANFNATGVTCGSATGGAVCPTSGNAVSNMQGGGIAIPTLPSGGSVTFTVTGTAGASGSISNTASVVPPAGVSDPGSGNNSSKVDTTIQTPNLAVAKSSNGPWSIGQNGAKYTITVTNNGLAPTGGTVTVRDTLPTGITPQWSSPSTFGNWSCAFSGQNFTCTSATAIAGSGATDSMMLPVNVTPAAVPSGTTATATNQAAVGGGGDPYNGGGVPTPGNCTPASDPHCTSNTTTVNTATNVTLVKNGPPAVLVNGPIGYTFDLGNSGGTSSTTTVTVQDQLPVGVVADSIANGTDVSNVNCGTLPSTAGALLACTITLNTPLAANAASGAVSFVLNATAPAAGGAITNYASTDPSGGTNPPTPGASCTPSASCGSATTQVNTLASITTTKVLSTINGSVAGANAPVKAGDVLVYTITSSDSGDTAGATTLTEHVPGQTTYTGADSGAWSCAVGSGSGTACTASQNVAAHGSASTTFTVTVVTLATPGTLSNSITSSADSSCANCSTSDPVLAPSLQASKSSNGPWTVGQSGAAYTLSVKNAGTAATSGTITVKDALPSGITPQWSSPSTFGNWSCSFSGQSVTCTSSTAIAVNATDTFTLPVNATASAVTSGTSAIATNQAAVGGGGDPYNGGSVPTPGNCSPSNDPHCATNPTTVNTPASITVAKSLDASTTTPIVGGQAIVYDLTATNTGGTAVTGYQFYEVVPTNTTFASIQSDATTNCTAGAAAGTLCTITFASVPANGTTLRTITFTAATPLLDGSANIANEITDNASGLPPGAGCTAGSSGAPGACTTPPASCGASDPHCVQTAVAQADMSATGAATQAVTAGTSVSVITTCTNNGSSAATNATCAVSGVPAGYNPITVCNPLVPDASLANGASISCTTTFTPTVAGTVTLTTTANSDTPDPSSANDSATSTVTVLSPASITTVKTLGTINGSVASAAAPVKAGDVLVYAITSTNGGDTAGSTTLTEHVPNQTTYTGADGGAWSCAGGSSAGTSCTAAQSVPAHSNISTTFTVTVVSSASSGAVANSVTSSSDGACANCSTSDPVTSADMSTAFSNVPSVMSPGESLTGLTLTCANIGPATALTATCAPSVTTNDSITTGITNVQCHLQSAPGTPVTPPMSVAGGDAIVCTFDYAVPGTAGGSDDPTSAITFSGATSAANDANAANNSAAVNAAVIDAVDDAVGQPGGTSGATYNVAGNDQVPSGSAYTLASGGTCLNASVSSLGAATYDVPATGSCTVLYKVCAPNPDQTQCDTATLTVTASAADVSAAVSMPAATAPGAMVNGTITCTNLTGTATNVTCTASAQDSTGSSVTVNVTNCSPLPPTALTVGQAITCDISYTAPGTAGGSDTLPTSVTVTATTSASDDNVPGNNTATALTAIVDAVDDAVGQPGGTNGASYNVAGNDQVPNNSVYTLVSGGSCLNAAVSSAGIATYDVPTSGSCTVQYQVCASSPNQTQCDTATLTVSAGAADVSAAANLPAATAPGATVSGTITCTNAASSAGAATNVTCTASAQDSTGNPIVVNVTNCNPSVPTSLNPGQSISCDVSYTAPGTLGGSDTVPTSITLTATTSASNDSVAANNTATATTTIVDAVDDAVGQPGGTTGASYNVAANDQVPNGSTYTFVSGGSCVNASVSNAGSATYDVPPSGNCTVMYQVCAPSPNQTQCDTATLTVTASAASVSAAVNVPAATAPGATVNGTITCTNAVSSAGAATNVSCTASAQDSTGANVPVAVTNCTPVPPTNLNPGQSITCDVSYTVPGTPGGSDTAPTSVTLTATTSASNDGAGASNTPATTAIIDAVDDSLGSVSAAAGGTTASVLVNDTVGASAATSGNSTLTPGTAPAPAVGSIAMNADGTITVAAGTSPGTYQYAYTLCVNPPTKPAACDTATATITVGASIAPAPDSGSATAGVASTPVANVALNDKVNGAQATLGAGGNATVATSGAWPAGITLDTTTGAVNVAATVPPGTYVLTYQLCDKSTPTPNCATTTVTITVAGNIVPQPDSGTATAGTASTPVSNVAANDKVNGAQATLGAGGNATVATSGTWPAGITLDATTGAVNVAASVPPGPYTMTYQLCDKSAPPNCATTTVTITVNAAVCTTTTGSVSGFIWNDKNRDGVYQPNGADGIPGTADDEVPLQTLLSLTPAGGGLTDTRILAADASGHYTFTNLTPGTYQVQTLDAYLGDLTPNPVYPLGTSTRTVTVSACADAKEDFRYAAPAPGTGVVGDFVWFDQDRSATVNEFYDANGDGKLTLNGASVTADQFEWIDINGNGVPDAGEYNRCGLSGVTVELLDSHSNVVATRMTDLRGAYFFTDLPLGQTYTTRVDGGDPANLARAKQIMASGRCLPYTPSASPTSVEHPMASVVPAAGAAPASATAASVTCFATTPLQRTSQVLTVGAPEDLNIDFGIVCSSGAMNLVDKSSTTPYDTSVQTDVLANDTSTAPLDPATLGVGTPPSHGTVSCNITGCTYTPSNGYVGVDSYTYQVCDESLPTPTCGTANVTITVQPSAVADPPVVPAPINARWMLTLLALVFGLAGALAMRRQPQSRKLHNE